MRKRIIYMLIALTQQAVSCPLGYEVEVNMSAAEDISMYNPFLPSAFQGMMVRHRGESPAAWACRRFSDSPWLNIPNLNHILQKNLH